MSNSNPTRPKSHPTISLSIEDGLFTLNAVGHAWLLCSTLTPHIIIDLGSFEGRVAQANTASFSRDDDVVMGPHRVCLLYISFARGHFIHSDYSVSYSRWHFTHGKIVFAGRMLKSRNATVCSSSCRQRVAVPTRGLVRRRL